jgi:hypothetical protein
MSAAITILCSAESSHCRIKHYELKLTYFGKFSRNCLQESAEL